MSVAVRRNATGRIVGARALRLDPDTGQVSSTDDVERKIAQVRPPPETQDSGGRRIDRYGADGEAQGRRRDHSPKRKMQIVERYEWRPTRADSGAHRMKLTLECGCVVERWKSQEPKKTARCEARENQ